MKSRTIKKKTNEKKTTPGFTIVELLIAIVIIAILASITVVAYNGIQQTSNNTVRISTASQYIKLIRIYVQQNGNTLMAQGHNCLNEVMAIDHDNDSQRECGFINKTVNDGKGTYDQSVITKLQQTSPKLPESPPAMVGQFDEFHGPTLFYHPDWVLNGQPSPYILMYLLEGEYKSCGVGIDPIIWGAHPNLTPTNQPYSETGEGWGETGCYIPIQI